MMRGGCEDGGLHCNRAVDCPHDGLTAWKCIAIAAAGARLTARQRGITAAPNPCFLRNLQRGERVPAAKRRCQSIALAKTRGKYHVSCVARIWPRHWSSRALGKTRPDAGQQAGAKCATLAFAHTSSQCRATSRQLLRPGRYQSPRPRPRRALPRQGTAEGRSRLWCRPVTRHRARMTRSRCSAVRASVPRTL